MNANVGMIDRVVRVVVGLLLIAYAIPIGFPSTGWNWVGWIECRSTAHRIRRLLPRLYPARRKHETKQISYLPI